MRRLEELTYGLSYEDVIEILRVVDDTPEGQELSLEIGDFKLTVKKDAPGAPQVPRHAATSQPVAAGATGAAPETPSVADPRSTVASAAAPVSPNAAAVTAPMVGTFYRAPAPGAAPYVDVGSRVEPDDIVAIIEVMKLMNEIRAGYRGRVVAILAENGTLVEYGQSLVVIEPSA